MAAAAAQAGPGVCGPRRADSWAGRAPPIKGNSLVRRDNRALLAGRRDLISDHAGVRGGLCPPRWGRGRGLCAPPGWVGGGGRGRTRSKPEKVHCLLQVRVGPSCRLGEMMGGQAERLRMLHKEQAPGAGAPARPAPALAGGCHRIHRDGLPLVKNTDVRALSRNLHFGPGPRFFRGRF